MSELFSSLGGCGHANGRSDGSVELLLYKELQKQEPATGDDACTHGSSHWVATVESCHRPAEAYLTTKRTTEFVSATPVAVPSGVDTLVAGFNQY